MTCRWRRATTWAVCSASDNRRRGGDTRFVPGHGAVADREFAFRQRAEIAMLYSQTEMLIKQGTKVEDAASATEWPFTAETMKQKIDKIFP